MGLASFFRRKPFERVGFVLYGQAVAAARQPVLFAEWGVPDTAAGRFEMVCLHNGLLIRRIKGEKTKEAQDLAQAVFDAMFSDMDVNLREMGIGDLSVGKRVKMLWEGFHGRATNYGEALEAGDVEGLKAALRRNVWPKEEPPEGALDALAARTREVAEALAPQPIEALMRGEVRFP